MAKGIGLIGNFKGKVGNMVGYKLSDSNTGNSQGIRVYQPIVKNPKTSAQAEQRAKLLAVNATYRTLKMVIDRGNEGLPYGNKSRLAWLKGALKAQNMPWIVKGMPVTAPVGCQLTKGSLPGVGYTITEDILYMNCPGVAGSETISTVGALSTAILAGYPSLKAGDQITVVSIGSVSGVIAASVMSFVIDTTSAEAISGLELAAGQIGFTSFDTVIAGAIIVSREGTNGEHLRSTSSLQIDATALAAAPYDAASKTAAIESYMSSASANADWAEESIQ